MKYIRKALNELAERWRASYIASKVLFFICMLCFATTLLSIFDMNLNASGNLVTIRTVFSSIVGYMLESSTSKKTVCNDKNAFFRNLVVAIISIASTVAIIFSYILNINPDNPSLILLKNSLFSCVGFLISASKMCNSENQ